MLTLVGRGLVVDDQPGPSDAIVVLAGGTPEREAAAAALFRQGWAPRVIVSRPALPDNVRELVSLGVRPLDLRGEAVLALAKYGVPPGHVVALDEPVSNTEAELARVHEFARAHGYRRVILVTSVFHTRRVSMVWSRAGSERIASLVMPTSSGAVAATGWWRKRRVAEAVLHEYLGIIVLVLGVSPLLR